MIRGGSPGVGAQKLNNPDFDASQFQFLRMAAKQHAPTEVQCGKYLNFNRSTANVPV